MAPTYYNTTDTAVTVRDDGRQVPPRTRYTGNETPDIARAVAAGLLVKVDPTSKTTTAKTEKE